MDRRVPASSSESIEGLNHWLTARLDEFGITRVADTTGLDVIGIPTHSVVKPGTSDVIWVYSGKGITSHHSRVSAIMECLERSCSLWDQRRVQWRSLESFGAEEVWSPELFTEAQRAISPQDKIGWVQGNSLTTNTPVWLPAELVFGGHRPVEPGQLVFHAVTSNGLGAHLTRERAILRAIYELMERDAISMAELEASDVGYSSLRYICKMLGVEETNILARFRDNQDVAFDVNRLDRANEVTELVQRFENAGLTIHLKNLVTDLGVSVMAAAVIERVSIDGVLATAGYSAAPDPIDAACAAILEVAQSRATDRQGAREDCVTLEKCRATELPSSHWMLTDSMREVSLKRRATATTHSESISEVLVKLKNVALEKAAVVDFPAYEGIHVVRVLVPGMETWHPTGGMSRIGPRMRKKLLAARSYMNG